MKILLLTPSIPYPLSEGGKVAQYAIIDYLRKLADVSLVIAINSKDDEKNADVLQHHWPDITIRKIKLFEQPPEPGLKEKAKNTIRNFLKKLYKKKNPAFKKDVLYSDTDHPYLVTLFPVKKRIFIDELAVIISEIKPDIIQIEILEYIDLVLALPADTKKIFVHQELRFGRLRSFFNDGKYTMTRYDHYVIEKIKKEELMFLKLYDGVFVLSEDDKIKLKEEGLNENVFIAPFPVLDNHFENISKENFEITKLVFVGAEIHAPNKDAIEWYLREIAGEINKIKKIVLHVIGNWSKKTIDEHKDNDAIHFAGYVEDLISYCKHSIMLVPVRFGSGIRAKILYAMAQGIPVISTTLGCEGLMVNDGDSILIANTPEAFAKSFKKILENKDYAMNITESAQTIAHKYYSQEAMAKLRLKYFESVLSKEVYV